MINNVGVEIRDLIRNSLSLENWLPKYQLQGEMKRAVFANNLPPELQDSTTITTLRIEEIFSTPTAFAGNHAQELEQLVQIQIWYAPETPVEDFEWALNYLLEVNGFYAVTNGGHQADEETQQMETTLQYRRFKQKRGS